MEGKTEYMYPNWKAFGQGLAIGEMRILGLAPVPPELKETVESIRKERLARTNKKPASGE